MKKVLATTLAVTMAAGMATTAFADRATTLKVDETSKIYVANDDGVLNEAASSLRVKPGQTIYVQILSGNEGEDITNELVSKYKVVAEWSHGKEYVESTGIETKKVSATTGYVFTGEGEPAYELKKNYGSLEEIRNVLAEYKDHTEESCQDEPCTEESHFTKLDEDAISNVLSQYRAEVTTSYRAVAAIKLKASLNTKLDDLMGSVKVIKKTSSNSTEATSKKITAEIGYGEVSASDTIEVDNDNPVVNFEDYEGEVELIFGNAASFVVDIRNQGRVYLAYSQKPNMDIIDQNPHANVDFMTFEGAPSFNKTGELRLFANEDSHVYEITAKGLKAVDAKYDETDGAYILNTRTLGSYAIADKELKYTVSAQDSNGGNGSTQGNKPHNPDTGVAVSLSGVLGMAVASLAAMGLTKKKD